MKTLCFLVVVLFAMALCAQTNNAPKATDAATAHNQHTDQANATPHPYGDFTLHNPTDPGNENGHPFGNPTFHARNTNTSHHAMPAPGSFTQGMIDRTTLMGQSTPTGLSSTTANTSTSGPPNKTGNNQQQSGNNTPQNSNNANNGNSGSNQQSDNNNNNKKQGVH